MTSLLRVLIVALLTPLALADSLEQAGDPPSPDPALEQRLKASQAYRSKYGDTLSRLARLLYGHASWWSRLREQNGELLKDRGPNDPIARGTEIRYLAPEIEDEYVVQPGDWLIRIAAWKYGATEKWELLFAANAEKISNPDLIRPGDRLRLENDGTVRNESTGKTIISGENDGPARLGRRELLDRVARESELLEKALQTFAGQQAKALADAREHAQPGGRGPAFADREPDPWSWESPYFVAGFLSGALLLLLGPLAWAWSRATQVKFVSHPGIEPVDHEGPLAEVREEPKPGRPSPVNDFDGFKRRPLEEPVIDRDLIHYADGEVDRRPGYHSLVPRLLRKYLDRREK